MPARAPKRRAGERGSVRWSMQRSTAALLQLKRVSLPVDPLRDTPEPLAHYGRTVGAEGARWVCLTGHPHDLDHVSRSLTRGGVDSTLRPDTHLGLVDRASGIRGYYSTSRGHPSPRLVADARRLLS